MRKFSVMVFVCVSAVLLSGASALAGRPQPAIRTGFRTARAVAGFTTPNRRAATKPWRLDRPVAAATASEANGNGIGDVVQKQFVGSLSKQGEMRNGLHETASWVHRFANGNVVHANWQDGVRQACTYAGDSSGARGSYSSGGGYGGDS